MTRGQKAKQQIKNIENKHEKIKKKMNIRILHSTKEGNHTADDLEKTKGGETSMDKATLS